VRPLESNLRPQIQPKMTVVGLQKEHEFRVAEARSCHSRHLSRSCSRQVRSRRSRHPSRSRSRCSRHRSRNRRPRPPTLHELPSGQPVSVYAICCVLIARASGLAPRALLQSTASALPAPSAAPVRCSSASLTTQPQPTCFQCPASLRAAKYVFVSNSASCILPAAARDGETGRPGSAPAPACCCQVPLPDPNVRFHAYCASPQLPHEESRYKSTR
jgi:hypothetical protein